MNWRHSGFSVHNAVRVARDDHEARERVAQYIIRNAFSVANILYNWCVTTAGTLCLRLKQGLLRPGDELRPVEKVEIIDVSGYQPMRIPSKTWRECIKKYGNLIPCSVPTAVVK